jgi:hypothetical protein
VGSSSSGTAGSTGTGTAGTSTSGTTCGCPAGEHCDPLGTGRCLDCLGDSDCATPTGVCQSSASYLQYGKCVECTESETTCPGTEVCDLSIGKTYHQCVADCRLITAVPPCVSDAGYVEHCVQATGTCVVGCASTTDCVATQPQLCDVDSGACVECNTPADCPYSNPGCNYHQCGSCSSDTNCPIGLACLIGNTNAFYFCGCPDGGGCGGDAPACNLVFSLCGCQSSTDCSSLGEVCQLSSGRAGSCIPPCTDGGTDCLPSNQFCDFDSGLCGPCSADSQCVGYDAGPHCLGTGYCGCNVSNDCGTNYVCGFNNACQLTCAIDGGTDCTQSSQFCDLDSGLCGPCETDSQCDGYDAGPRCLTSGQCGCGANSDCGTGYVCDSSACRASCAVDGGTDCTTLPGRHFCDLGTGLCNPCSSDTQCVGEDAGPHCLSSGDCGCQTSSDCGLSGACDFSSDACVLSCTVDGGPDCASLAEVCDPDNRVCVQCLSDTDCSSSTPACTADIHQGNSCVECVLPSQCPDSNPGCNASYEHCGYCYTDVDCPSHFPLCSLSNTCVTSCVLSDGGTSCSTGGCDTNSGLCVQCVQDSNCLQAAQPYCATDVDGGEYCVECTQPSQCPGTAPGCNSYYHNCGWCFSDSDCPTTAPFCNGNESCVLPCDGGGQCPTGACNTDAGFCVECVQDSDCQQAGFPYCAADVGAGNFCGQCVASSDCGDAGPCNGYSLQCGTCASNTDCPAEVPICLYFNGYCTDGGF